MRWQHYLPPQPGDWRYRTRFLVFPKRIGNETRWLERAKWREVLKERDYDHEGGSVAPWWEPTNWEN